MSARPSRLEQISALMTAMISIIVSGSSDLIVAAVPDLSTQYLNLPADILKKFSADGPGPYFGVLSQIAREVGVSRSVVGEVLYGRSKSNRVVPVLLAKLCELEQIEDPSTITSPHPRMNSLLSLKDLEQFKNGGRYYGICARVGRSLGLPACQVSHAARGRKTNKRALDAVRAEMARVDAELAAKNGDAR